MLDVRSSNLIPPGTMKYSDAPLMQQTALQTLINQSRPKDNAWSFACEGGAHLQGYLAGILKTVGGTFLFLRTFSKNGRFTFLRNKNVHQKWSVLILRFEGSSTREPHFSREMWAPFSPRKFASSILRGGKRSGADFFLI